MAALQVTLVSSWAGTSERIRRTLEGLGLYRISDTRTLPDTAASLGMVKQVGHLVTYERTKAEYKPTGRRHLQGRSKKAAGKTS